MLESLTVTILAEDTVGYETPFLGQHGVSFLLEAISGNPLAAGTIDRRVLVDVAQNPEALLHNMSLLDIDPASIDAIVLTHCHYDHTQGLVEILKAIDRGDTPVIAHPDIFRLNFATAPELRHIGIMNSDSRERIEAAGGTLFLLREPLQIVPGLSTSGEIPRSTDYENTETNLHTIVDGRVVIDRMIDEIALYAAIDGAGTVVVTGCSHSGIVNITRHAGGFFAKEPGSEASRALPPVAAIIGGFHLIESGEERITKTVADLRIEKVGHVYGGHCTGFPAQVALAQEFGSRFTPLRTGDRYRFGPGSKLPIVPR